MIQCFINVGCYGHYYKKQQKTYNDLLVAFSFALSCRQLWGNAWKIMLIITEVCKHLPKCFVTAASPFLPRDKNKHSLSLGNSIAFCNSDFIFECLNSSANMFIFCGSQDSTLRFLSTCSPIFLPALAKLSTDFLNEGWPQDSGILDVVSLIFLQHRGMHLLQKVCNYTLMLRPRRRQRSNSLIGMPVLYSFMVLCAIMARRRAGGKEANI